MKKRKWVLRMNLLMKNDLMIEPTHEVREIRAMSPSCDGNVMD